VDIIQGLDEDILELSTEVPDKGLADNYNRHYIRFPTISIVKRDRAKELHNSIYPSHVGETIPLWGYEMPWSRESWYIFCC